MHPPEETTEQHLQIGLIPIHISAQGKQSALTYHIWSEIKLHLRLSFKDLTTTSIIRMFSLFILSSTYAGGHMDLDQEHKFLPLILHYFTDPFY